eukprot:gb/GEZN01002730.1/.p1 GENE.gb/GEZN01002730.1/~~gb/GEZN01002730.1/.p1  ORF type:complete len:646 (+),score=160.48 gb/GEZN01002730.1/:23-1960(+)
MAEVEEGRLPMQDTTNKANGADKENSAAEKMRNIFEKVQVDILGLSKRLTKAAHTIDSANTIVQNCGTAEESAAAQQLTQQVEKLQANLKAAMEEKKLEMSRIDEAHREVISALKLQHLEEVEGLRSEIRNLKIQIQQIIADAAEARAAVALKQTEDEEREALTASQDVAISLENIANKLVADVDMSLEGEVVENETENPANTVMAEESERKPEQKERKLEAGTLEADYNENIQDFSALHLPEPTAEELELLNAPTTPAAPTPTTPPPPTSTTPPTPTTSTSTPLPLTPTTLFSTTQVISELSLDPVEEVAVVSSPDPLTPLPSQPPTPPCEEKEGGREEEDKEGGGGEQEMLATDESGETGIQRPTKRCKKNNQDEDITPEKVFIPEPEPTGPLVKMSKNTAAQLKEIRKALKDLDPDWSKRSQALAKLEKMVIEEKVMLMDGWRAQEEKLREPLAVQATDLRSSIIKQVTGLLVEMSLCAKNRFDEGFAYLIPTLLKLLYVSIKVISLSGDQCLKAVLQNTHTPKLLPPLFLGCKDSHGACRKGCVEYLGIYLTQALAIGETFSEANIRELEDTIVDSTQDADASTRMAARQLYELFCKKYSAKGGLLWDRLTVQTQKTITLERKKPAGGNKGVVNNQAKRKR